MSIRNFLNRFRRFRTEPRVGDRVIVNFINAEGNAVERSCTGTISTKGRIGLPGAVFVYWIQMDTGEFLRSYSDMMHYDNGLKMWTVRR